MQYVRSLDADSAFAGARRFVRSHPAWFLGGAFVTGLALARLFKATPPRQLSSGVVPREEPAVTTVYATGDEGGIQ